MTKKMSFHYAWLVVMSTRANLYAFKALSILAVLIALLLSVRYLEPYIFAAAQSSSSPLVKTETVAIKTSTPSALPSSSSRRKPLPPAEPEFESKMSAIDVRASYLEYRGWVSPTEWREPKVPSVQHIGIGFKTGRILVEINGKIAGVLRGRLKK